MVLVVTFFGMPNIPSQTFCLARPLRESAEYPPAASQPMPRMEQIRFAPARWFGPSRNRVSSIATASCGGFW